MTKFDCPLCPSFSLLNWPPSSCLRDNNLTHAGIGLKMNLLNATCELQVVPLPQSLRMAAEFLDETAEGSQWPELVPGCDNVPLLLTTHLDLALSCLVLSPPISGMQPGVENSSPVKKTWRCTSLTLDVPAISCEFKCSWGSPTLTVTLTLSVWPSCL